MKMYLGVHAALSRFSTPQQIADRLQAARRARAEWLAHQHDLDRAPSSPASPHSR